MRIIPVRLAFAALISAAAIAAPLALAPATAQATAVRHVPFTQAAFAAAQAAGKPILIDVYAPWCPVCRAQQAPIAAAQADPANADLVVFRLDWNGWSAEYATQGDPTPCAVGANLDRFASVERIQNTINLLVDETSKKDRSAFPCHPLQWAGQLDQHRGEDVGAHYVE